MPAFGAEALGSLFRKAGAYATEKLRASEIGSMFIDSVSSQRNEFMRSPQGVKILEKMDAFTQQKQQILQGLMKPVEGVMEAVKNDPTKLRQNIGDLHSDFVATGHAAAQHTGNILASDPQAAAKDLKTYTTQAYSQANMLAQLSVFGKDHSKLVNDIMPLYDSADSTLHSHADAMLNILANQFHDTSKLGGIGLAFSKTKLDIKKALQIVDDYRFSRGLKPLGFDPEELDISSVYQKRNALENWASQRVRMYLAPLIVIPHMSTFFNYATAPLTAIAKATAGMGRDEVKQLLDSTGIFGSQMHHMIAEDIASRTGFTASKTGRPEVGAILGKLFHNPGFNFVRNLQIKAGALIGYHSLLHWTEGALKGDRRSIAELEEMGLNVRDIISRRGQLTQEEKAKAIFHFVNNRIFIDRAMDRSLMATKNPWGRVLTMFHGYVVSQQAFMRRELQKMLDSGDYVGIARYAGTVGVLFPAVAPMIKSAEILGRTASIQQAGQSMQSDYNKLTQPESAGQFTAEYLDMLSYFGSWGTFHGFLQAAWGDRLATALMGPIVGSAVRTSQDIINLATKPSKSGGRNIRPVAKDILQQTVPVLGNIAANQLFPTRKPKE